MHLPNVCLRKYRRIRYFAAVSELAYTPVNAVSPSELLDSNVKIG